MRNQLKTIGNLSFSKYEKKHSSPSSNPKKDHSVNQTNIPGVHQTNIPDVRRREEGVVVRLSKDEDFGFITPDSKSYGKDLFFHCGRCLVNKGQIPHVGDRVQFYVSKRKQGYEANEVRIQVCIHARCLYRYFNAQYKFHYASS